MKHTWKIVQRMPSGAVWWMCGVCKFWFSTRHLSEERIQEYKERDDCDVILSKRAIRRILK